MMHGHEKSDPAIVAVKPANKAEQSAASWWSEGRDGGECGPTKHAPGTEPDKCDTGRWLVYGKLLCRRYPRWSRMREAARTDLGGGREGNSRPYREAPICCTAYAAHGT